MELFRGFQGAHGTYRDEVLNEDKRKQEIKQSARTLQRPVTEDLWARHLGGEYHLGIITIGEDNNCWWGAVDIDDYSVSHTELIARIDAMNLPALVARTKSGGAHVFMFFSEPIPAKEVMSKLRELSAALGYGGCEVYPKQDHVVTEMAGLGNWLNMPYFNGDQGKTYSVRADGRGHSLHQFLSLAEGRRITRRKFAGLVFRATRAGWEEAPPCLEHLAGAGVGQGIQNNAMFSFGVLAKKMDPEHVMEQLMEWNRQFFSPLHETDRIINVVKGLEKKDYNYKCHDAPCVSHCNMALCRTRKYGIGPGGGADIIESVSILDTEPPLFYVLLKTGGTVECDGATLLSPRDFQRSVLEQLQMVVPQYKQDTWLPRVQQCVESAIRIEAPAEVGTTGRMWELLEMFCTDRHAAERVEELILGKPWRDDERGMVWFRLRDLRDFLDRSKFSLLRPSQITERIKKSGGGSQFFNVHGRGVNVWGVPTGKLSWMRGSVDTPDVEESPL